MGTLIKLAVVALIIAGLAYAVLKLMSNPERYGDVAAGPEAALQDESPPAAPQTG